MENRIRKAIREQIKKLHEANQALQVTTENGVVAIIEDPKDIEAYDRGNTVIGTTAKGEKIELNIDWSSESHMTANEGMSPEEWADAKEAERLANHPEKAKINKIKQMMDKEEDDKEQAEYDKGWYGESLKELAAQLGYLNEEGKYDKKSQEEFDLNFDELDYNDAEWIRYEVDNEGYLEEKEQTDVEKGKEVDGMEGVDEQGLDQIERGINQITDGGRQSARVSDRGDKIRVMFRYMRGEFDGETWEAILEYLSDNMGYKILDQSNYYEANYDREEPAEAVPTIYLQK
jgi:hypothetical protein